ncbi:uncharacterized protein LOC126994590 isoform X1 [Eriocheir sinensis]|uniref:uncharacterized protein LOC126994590 isoform X1 n=2 Tax=Eriocheir sinensis TaxID=95602 RepID=UPI0021C617DA|nr:uncharacterized protein LOC126994590 isoform X1 [Eriocheir sinensis]
MMQVSTLYAQSLERQLVSRRSQLINFSRSSCGGQVDSRRKPADTAAMLDPLPPRHPSMRKDDDHDPRECTDRLCRLPSQNRGGHLLGSPRRQHSSASVASATRLTQSTGNLSVQSDLTLLKKKETEQAVGSPPQHSPVMDKKAAKKAKEKKEKEAKRTPSNFMLLTPWFTRQNCEKLLSQVRSGDIFEFNIKLHHHWGIAILPKNKKPSLANLELAHLLRDKDGRQRAVRQPLKDYWHEGVTARINNSRDVHKPPLPAGEVTSAALKLIVQPYRVWQNSEQMVVSCRYGDGQRARQLSDAARWGSLSRCVGLWLTLTSSTHTSPTGSPGPLRKRTVSVNF